MIKQGPGTDAAAASEAVQARRTVIESSIDLRQPLLFPE
jgi:hypothetical protein